MSCLQFSFLVNFAEDIGLIFSGAAVIWGWISFHMGLRRSDNQRGDLHKISGWMLPVFLIGSLPLIGSLMYQFVADANLRVFLTLFFLLILWLTGFFIRGTKSKSFQLRNEWFYTVAIICTIIFIGTSTTTVYGEVNSYEILHTILRVFTLGSALVAAILYLRTRRSPGCRSGAYILFGTMSKVIWVMVALDVLALWVLNDYLVVGTKFYLEQASLGVVILIGAILTGPILSRLIGSEGKIRRVGRLHLHALHTLSAVLFATWMLPLCVTCAGVISRGADEVMLRGVVAIVGIAVVAIAVSVICESVNREVC
ncbi:MAG: hypothetical protein ABIA47_00190 [bacterium]